MRTNPNNNANGRAASTELEMARLVGVIAALREHCPWTAELTHESLTTYLLEESYELIEAIESGHAVDIAGELGDILLQVVLHARISEESGNFDLADVARGLSEKMIRRSPHVFHPDGSLQDTFPATIAEIEASWERVKAQERAMAGEVHGDAADDAPGDAAGHAVPVAAPGVAWDAAAAPAANPFAGIPTSLPALAMAHKTLERAGRAGLDPPDPADHVAGDSETEGELGKLLFDVVHRAQLRGLDAERALRRAVRDFQDRS